MRIASSRRCDRTGRRQKRLPSTGTFGSLAAQHTCPQGHCSKIQGSECKGLEGNKHHGHTSNELPGGPGPQSRPSDRSCPDVAVSLEVETCIRDEVAATT